MNSKLAIFLILIVLGVSYGLMIVKQSVPLEPPQTIAAGAENCVATYETRHEQGECFFQLATELFDYYEPIDFENYFQEGVDRAILINCHEFMHYVGWRQYQESESLADAFLAAVPACNQGMYHGIVEEHIKTLNFDTNQLIPELLHEACTSKEIAAVENTAHVAGLCFHGVGHGLMFVTKKNLPESLDLCDQIPDGYRQNCYTGAYMENLDSKAIGGETAHRSNYYDPTDPTYPCRILKPHQQKVCYSYEAADLINIYPGDREAWFAACLDFPEEYRDTCYNGIGVNIPAPSIPARETESMCSPALAYGVEPYKNCMQGVLTSIDSHYNGDPEAFVAVCDEVVPEVKNFCYRESGNELSGWLAEGETLRSKCSAFVHPEAIAHCSGDID